MTLLPVLATVLVIVAGGRAVRRTVPGRLAPSGRPVDRPALVRDLPVALARPRSVRRRSTAHCGYPRARRVALAVGLSAASLRLVEDPVRHSSWLALRAARADSPSAGHCARQWCSPSGGCRSATHHSTPASCRRADPPAAGTVTPVDDGGAAVVRRANGATRPSRPCPCRPARRRRLGLARDRQPGRPRAGAAHDRRAFKPAPVARVGRRRPGRDLRRRLRRDRRVPNSPHAGTARTGRRSRSCSTATRTPRQWSPALKSMANARGFELIVLAKGGCPVAAVSIPTATLARTCPIWRDPAIAYIATAQPDVVIVSAWADYPNADDEWSTGFAATMSAGAQVTPNVVVLGDNPPARRAGRVPLRQPAPRRRVRSPSGRTWSRRADSRSSGTSPPASARLHRHHRLAVHADRVPES